MSNFITDINITNFKSIKNCEIKNFKRINLFIGRPNVGKSNIIEALSVFSIPYLKENTSKKLSTIIRLENETELFYNGNTNAECIIKTNLGNCMFAYDPKEGLIADILILSKIFSLEIDDKLNIKGILTDRLFQSPIKRYNYKQDVDYKKSHAKYLIPPNGPNLLTVIENYNELRNQVVAFFNEYGLSIAFDMASQTIKIVEQIKGGIFLIPYNSIADTLQRLIFYKAAIASNNNSVLLFEEPEAHSFPPYMSYLTQDMIYKKDNQFFIATHSAYILNNLLENARDEIGIFIVSYDHHQTKVKQLDDHELHDVFQNGIDLFTNNESFI